MFLSAGLRKGVYLELKYEASVALYPRPAIERKLEYVIGVSTDPV